MPKKLLFISHASPEDNYLAGWLASKLRLLGYEVWVDIKDLRTGGAFWNEIELRMRNESIRCIALVSEHFIAKSRDKDSGVYSEVVLAKVLSKKIDNYVFPIKVDGSSYDDFPLNILPLDTIDFSKNWGAGLKELTGELEEQKIPRGTPDDKVLLQWHEYQKIQGDVINKREFYASNWFRFTHPKSLYVYKFLGEIKNLYAQIPFPLIRDGDYVMGFFSDGGLDFHHSYSEQIDTQDFIDYSTITLQDGHEIKDAPQKLIRLLNKCIDQHFHNMENYGAFRGSGKNWIFYPKYDEKKSGYISLKAFNKRGRKLYATEGKIKWRFGLSFLFQLTPFPHMVAHYHLVASNDNGILDKEPQKKARRSIASGWFNREWYERELAHLYLASELSEDLELTMPVGSEDMVIDIRPITFRAKQSYAEN